MVAFVDGDGSRLLTGGMVAIVDGGVVAIVDGGGHV